MNKGEFVKKVATKLDGEYTQAEEIGRAHV